MRGGKLVHLAGTPTRGLLQWIAIRYPPTAWPIGPAKAGNTPVGHNLAVFYASCTADCLFCQNWHFREASPEGKTLSARELAAAANSRTFCVCYFGGDPASQMPHALAASRYLAERGVRVCWETNGTMHLRLLDAAVQVSLETGGCVKVRSQGVRRRLHLALTGVSNRRDVGKTLRGPRGGSTSAPRLPLVIASTLLVPGYVDADQVGQIARFIASINLRIPYALLAFAPHFYLPDLPCTSARHAQEAEAAAARGGTGQRAVGNRHLLGRE